MNKNQQIEQMQNLIESLKQVASPEILARLLTQAHMTDHDLFELSNSVGDALTLDIEDVYEFIDENKDRQKDLLDQIFCSFDDIVARDEQITELYKENSATHRLIKTVRFNELSDEAKEYATHAYVLEISQSIKHGKLTEDYRTNYEQALVDLTDENFLYDERGYPLNED